MTAAVKPTFMPLSANVPAEWIIESTLETQVIIVPSSREIGATYRVTMDLETRALVCDCLGFVNRSTCRHVKGLVWWCNRPRSSKVGAGGAADTSIVSFHTFSEEELGERQREVYAVIRQHGPIFNRRVAQILHLGVNQVTPRVHELRKLGVVEDAGYATDLETARKVRTWQIVEGVSFP